MILPPVKFPYRPVGVLLVAGALVLSACGTRDDGARSVEPVTAVGTVTSTVTETSSPTPRETTDATGTARADAGLTPLGDADTTMKTLRPGPAAQLVTTGVRVGTHEGFDRVVFDLVGDGTPGWFIDYNDRPAQQGSGFPIDFPGDSAIEVNIDGTTYPFTLGLENPQIEPTTGPGPIVAGVTSGFSFEGRTQFVIGVNGGKHPYSVQVLENPTRLVIDILRG
ncbi:AMIN-like domain-containing (lipo)protein [Corynebacterium pygosceleis]|uniref:AMIN-like domain-containing protein n=1 Tax=Corynebacterium pygosceleis TaxID=2800406 RepID=A0A9Q4C7M2_9CORY|nr:hypothetical protein [Corynebacterium pygosceleis]MCK7637601.1 hypothetical protein [Corynebacterium pygosceleis]MCK7674792.1 hypothetical protein [Corynebacterium pygosceleis]MCL0119619.1 hypothetical protein [Corynebacterium pygosceleis]MCX7468070.1 hypothetical protein [Corynebacterium pygosceleis]